MSVGPIPRGGEDGPGGGPPAPGRAAKPVSNIGTDTFCAACGFNLQTQPVWRDPELGILVCRCPECGQHHPAGVRTTAPNVWLGRLAVAGWVVWGLLGLAFILAVFGTYTGIHAMIQEELLQTVEETLAGTPVKYEWKNSTWVDDNGATVDSGAVVMRHRVAPWFMRAVTGHGRPDEVIGILICVFFGLVGTILSAAVLAAGTWFWPRWKRYLWLIIPVLASMLVILMASQPQTSPGAGSPLRLVGPNLYLWAAVAMAALQIVVMAIGLRLGLAVARLAVRMLVPPRARKMFAFLWLSDGLTPSL